MDTANCVGLGAASSGGNTLQPRSEALLFMYVFIYLLIYLFAYLFIYLFTNLFI
jgi:hypothetical protein